MTEPSEIPSRLLKDLNKARSKHLTYAQLEDFVDSRLEATEREYVRAHIDLCTQCNRELEDLQWFSESRHYRQQVAAAAAPARPSFWEGLGQWLKVARRSLAVAGVAIAVAVLIAVVVKMQTPSSEQPSVATTAAPARFPATSSTAVATVPEVAGALPNPAAVAIPVSSSRSGGSRKRRVGPRVLSEAEAGAYLAQLAQAPNDPETRAAIAIKTDSTTKQKRSTSRWRWPGVNRPRRPTRSSRG